jgi:hypothetical protein
MTEATEPVTPAPELLPAKRGEIRVFEFKNVKQNEFYDLVMKCVARLPGFDYRYFFYGGAIRGGKTYVCLFILWILAQVFPGSRWYVIREDNPALESTSIPSMEKLIGKSGPDFRWIRSRGDIQIVLTNGSRIFFKSENLIRDPELKEFLGLEMNGCLMEQMEALSERAYNRIRERLGSWYIDPMPIPLLLGTFNPSPTWIKKAIYDKHMKDELLSPFMYMPALPNDNPFVTQDQWDNWSTLDPESINVMIKGMWSFKQDGNIFAYAFREDFHIVPDKIQDAKGVLIPNPEMQLNRGLPVYCIFDFNVDPMTCLIAQKEGIVWGKVIAEYRIRNSDIFEVTERIQTDLINQGFYIICTGDASGRNRAGQTKGAKSYVDIIRAELRLSDRQMQFPLDNPSVKNTRVVLNSVLHNHKNFKISSACIWLIDDLLTVKTDSHGDIDKKKLDKLKTHLLDNLRYFLWNYFRTFVKVNFSSNTATAEN